MHVGSFWKFLSWQRRRLTDFTAWRRAEITRRVTGLRFAERSHQKKSELCFWPFFAFLRRLFPALVVLLGLFFGFDVHTRSA